MKHSLIAVFVSAILLGTSPAALCQTETDALDEAPVAQDETDIIDLDVTMNEDEPNAEDGTAPAADVDPDWAAQQAADRAAMLQEANRLRSQAAQPAQAVSRPLAAEPDAGAMRIAFLMPPKDSPMQRATQMALEGVLAANYASDKPARVLLVQPTSDGSVIRQLDAAVRQGAMAAIGPLDRAGVEQIAALNYLPLPVVTLNQVDLDRAVPMSAEEIAAERARVRALHREQDATALAAPEADTQPTPVDRSARIAQKTAVPGLITADETAVNKVRFVPRQFPRNLLMLGLSMEDDAQYIARLGIAALPARTSTGKRPKVLLLEHDAPLEKRIAQAFEHTLVAAGYAPDRLTVDVNDMTRVKQLFRLVVGKLSKEEFNEKLIDQEADPVGWRQQQIRIRRLEASKRARAALSEPPYQAAFLAMDASLASQVRSRLPMRTRIWGSPIINPGDTRTNPQAKAMTYDLLHVALVDAPLVLDFDAQQFEQAYRVPAPKSVLAQRLFALGADALTIAQSVASGVNAASFNGELGQLVYNLALSPKVERRGQAAIILGGEVRPMEEADVVGYKALNSKTPLRKMRAQSRALERLEREAAAAARAAGTHQPVQEP